MNILWQSFWKYLCWSKRVNTFKHVRTWWRNISTFSSSIAVQTFASSCGVQTAVQMLNSLCTLGHFGLILHQLPASLCKLGSCKWYPTVLQHLCKLCSIASVIYFSPVCTFIVEYRTSPAQMLGLARGPSPTKHETGKSSHQVAPPPAPSPKCRIRNIHITISKKYAFRIWEIYNLQKTQNGEVFTSSHAAARPLYKIKKRGLVIRKYT